MAGILTPGVSTSSQKRSVAWELSVPGPRIHLRLTIPYPPILMGHIFAGTAGLLSGTAAISFRKGSPRHVLAGKIFVVSMLTMAALAVYLAIGRHQPNNIGGGIETFYLIGTGWLTAKRRDRETSRFDWIVLLIPLTLDTLTWMNGIKIVSSGASSQDGVSVGMTFFMGSVMLLAAAGDVRMLLAGGVAGAKRIARHLRRMCFGLFIAAGPFFFGPSNRPLRLLSTVGIGQHLSPALFSTPLYLILTVLPLILLIFWLIRVRFANAYQGSIQLASASPDVTR
ncbi:MAG: hypothetical protein WB729_03960 [Candidatus Sulfotelmatobacter sp.]